MSEVHEKLLATLATQAVDAANPPEDGVPRVLVFTDGRPLLVPLADVLPELVEVGELDATPAPPAGVETIKLYDTAAEQNVVVESATLHSFHVKKGQPCTVKLSSAVDKMKAVSARLRLNVQDTLTLPDIEFWAGGKPDIKGHGDLLVSRMRFSDGTMRVAWHGSWLPWVAV